MSHYSSGHNVGGHYLSGHYGIRVARVYTTTASRVLCVDQERVLRAEFDNRLIDAGNIERLMGVLGVEVVEIDSQNRIISIDLDDRILIVDNVNRLIEAD